MGSRPPARSRPARGRCCSARHPPRPRPRTQRPSRQSSPPAPAPSPRQAAEGKPSLDAGSRGPAVVFVQEKLGVAPATGYYGPLTRSAVSTLQEINDLKVTGKVGPATWKILLAAEGVIELPLDAASAADRQPPRAPAHRSPATPPALTPEQAAAARPLLTPGMGPGDPAVIYVQQYLRVSPATGFFGKLTTQAVTAYQAGLPLPVTGTVDAATWEAILTGRTAAPVPPPTTPTPPKPAASDHSHAHLHAAGEPDCGRQGGRVRPGPGRQALRPRRERTGGLRLLRPDPAGLPDRRREAAAVGLTAALRRHEGRDRPAAPR